MSLINYLYHHQMKTLKTGMTIYLTDFTIN